MSGKVIGYARVSSAGQSLEVQLDKLKAAGCVKIYQEKVSGKTAEDRPQLQALMDFIREGDTVIITKLDRLGRSLADLLALTAEMERKGVVFQVLDQAIDTSTSQGRLMFSMLGAFAAFELDIRKERQMEGVAKAREAGKYKGGRKRIDDEPIKATVRENPEITVRALAEQHGVSRAHAHRVMLAMRAEAEGESGLGDELLGE